jgi:hypothetical protein
MAESRSRPVSHTPITDLLFSALSPTPTEGRSKGRPSASARRAIPANMLAPSRLSTKTPRRGRIRTRTKTNRQTTAQPRAPTPLPTDAVAHCAGRKERPPRRSRSHTRSNICQPEIVGSRTCASCPQCAAKPASPRWRTSRSAASIPPRLAFGTQVGKWLEPEAILAASGDRCLGCRRSVGPTMANGPTLTPTVSITSVSPS